MATKIELFIKVQNGTATASEIEELAKLLKEEATSKKKIEDGAKTLIAEIKKANIEPQTLTNLLASEGLIVLPKIEGKEEKIIIAEEPITTKAGRSSTFKIWLGRDVNALTADAKEYWTALKGKGFEYFKTILTEEGKAQYEKEDGKKYINGLFGIK